MHKGKFEQVYWEKFKNSLNETPEVTVMMCRRQM